MASPSSAALSVEEALSQPVEELLPSDPQASTSTSPSAQTSLNGSSTQPPNSHNNNGHTAAVVSKSFDADLEEDADREEAAMSSQELLQELRRVRQERDAFEGQYKGLLGKLTQMRSTLGDRLRQDAEELDRRESQINTLTAHVQDLQGPTSTLKAELIASHQESERVTKELDNLRHSSAKAIEEATSAATTANLQRSSSSTRSVLQEDRDHLEVLNLELQQSLESLKVQISQHETARREEASMRENLEANAEQARLDKDFMESEVRRWRGIAETAKESARNLQLVLEEFQSEQDSELQRAIGDYQQKYDSTAAQLEEYKERVRIAERRYAESKDATERSKALEQDVKEKNLLIGKLRHEAVILNEHLTEALRRLNQDNSSLTVDRRLVTNVLLQFLTTPRQDAKRFEMLSLLASILQWSDEEKELAGIQRSGPSFGRRMFGGGGAGGSAGRSASSTGSAAAHDESFSNLFVEYLLSEADKAKTAPTSPSSAALAPTFSTRSVSSSSVNGGGAKTAPPSRSNFDLGSLEEAAGGSGSAAGKGEAANHTSFGSSRWSGSMGTAAGGAAGGTSPVRQKINITGGAKPTTDQRAPSVEEK